MMAKTILVSLFIEVVIIKMTTSGNNEETTFDCYKKSIKNWKGTKYFSVG
jgi:hypothetical protein